jgi:hypothetical protein
MMGLGSTTMLTDGQVLEGTWEEIAERAEELAGRRIRVTVLSNGRGAAEAPAPGESLADALEGLVGVIRSRRGRGVSHASEDETTFGDYLEEKRRKGRL